MKYKDLRNFILYDMKPDMSSGEPKNYQPVMIMALNKRHGKAEKKKILNELQKANPNQKLTDNNFRTVFQTLRDRKIVEQKGDYYYLLDYDTIDKHFGRKAEITKCCKKRIKNPTLIKEKPIRKTDFSTSSISYWVSSGSWKNWNHTINNPPIRWGITEKDKNLWDKINTGDIVFCSASSKTPRIFKKNGIFMVGKVTEKYELDKRDGYYPDSYPDSKDFFKFRFELDPIKIVKTDEELLPFVAGLVFRKSINRITNSSTIRKLSENLEKYWNVEIESQNNYEKIIHKFDQNRKLFRSWWKTDEERKQELYEFTSRYPIDNIPDMKIEDYVFGIPDPKTGKSKEDTFCYMLEHSLQSFGGIRGTPNEKFGIYFNKSKKNYSYDEDRYNSPQAAFEVIKKDIFRILQAGRQFQKDGDWKKLSDVVDQDEGHNITSHVRSKILVAYFPNECIGIHSRKSLLKILEKLGTPREDLRSKITLMQSEILKIKNSHAIMRKWSNADYAHFLWSAVQKDKDPDEEKTEGETVLEEVSANYLLLRHNPDFKRKKTDREYWDDVLGKEYNYGKTVVNYQKVLPNSKTIWFYTDKDDLYFWGNGDVKQTIGIKDGKFVATMKNFNRYGLDEVPKAKSSVQKKIKSHKGWNRFNSIIEINKDIYDEIVNSIKMLEPFNDAVLHQPSTTEINKGLAKIEEGLLIPPQKIKEIVTSLASGNHVILAGPIGTGKTELARLIPEIFWDKVGGYYSDVYTATADWNTQDVIGGIIPKMDGDKVKYKIQDGCVTESVKKNWEGNSRKYHFARGRNYNGVWTIIDEFNRADIDKAFGQLFTSLRTRELKIPTNLFNESNETITIPQDFRIIGTLNTADKHYLFPLSDALKSRFAFIDIDVPSLEQRDKEIYYALDRARRFLKRENISSLVSLDEKNKKVKNTKKLEFFDTLYQAYNFLAFVRLFKKLGTAILKIIYQNLLTGDVMGMNLNDVLDNAINSTIIPQLERMSETQIEAIKFMHKNTEDFIEYLQNVNKSTSKRNVSGPVFKKILEFLDLNPKEFEKFSKIEVKSGDELWKKLKTAHSKRKQKPETNLAENLDQVEKSLDSLIEQSII